MIAWNALSLKHIKSVVLHLTKMKIRKSVLARHYKVIIGVNSVSDTNQYRTLQCFK